MVPWDVEFSDEFEKWWNTLTISEQEDVAAYVGMLEEAGPGLRYPYCSGVAYSRHARMRELRVQHQGRPYRVLYAFDPRRTAILLIGGDKTGKDRWYEEYVPVADRIYDEHLNGLRKEEESNGKEV
ncbi:MAG TPA: type II toxin-antitoxin system RelE/ParE family toxin [Bryobacteraceae bacterium]|nr:type II toxin-antitoxin system RelE/ParE family toxin [Bryobacteraceae bacterium]